MSIRRTRGTALSTSGALPLAYLALAGVASASELDDEPDLSAAANVISKLAAAGGISPLALGADLGDERALVVGLGGYDSARGGALFDSAAEVRISRAFSLRGAVTYSADTARMRPSVGARAQLLRQRAHGIDGALAAFYKTEGFDEMEGEVEVTASVGRRFDRFYLLGNVAYGQDPEGKERDGELRGSFVQSRGRVVLGVEGRARAALGPQQGAMSAVEPRLDAVGGPIAMVTLGTFVLFAEAGPSAVKMQMSRLHWGGAALVGVGSGF
jgi:hypothetical protein